jgi:small GTP-binding protein
MFGGTSSFRVVIIGDAETGKTSIIQTFLRQVFDPNQKPTVGAVFHTITREINNETVIMQIWDTAGQERYRSIGPIYYRNASAAIAVFDVGVRDFAPSLDAWIANVRRTVGDPLIIVVGNKSDLLTDDREVTARMKEFAESHKADCLLTSAKTGSNIPQLFDRLFAGLVKANTVQATAAAPPIVEPEVNIKCC